MGNRCVVAFVDHIPATSNPYREARLALGDATGTAFAVYQQWGADDVRDWLKKAAALFRRGDAAQCAVRWSAHLASKYADGLSVYLTTSAYDPENGLYVVDCSTGKVTLLREGRDGSLARSGRPFTLKMGL